MMTRLLSRMCSTACILTLFLVGSSLRAADLSPTVEAWLAAQTNVHAWSASFTQVRTLKALVQPLKANGRIWFAAPNRFRWELGDPAQTIAVRDEKNLRVIYPKLRRVEVFPLDTTSAGPWRDALALLEAGFPRNAAELKKQFNVLAERVSGNEVTLELQPTSRTARRMMPRVTIVFQQNDHNLKSTELQFADGSKLRNDFTGQHLNPVLPPGTFSIEVPADYTISTPLSR